MGSLSSVSCSKAGYFSGGLRKIEAAEQIAPHMDPSRNTSHSFQVFRDALLEAAPVNYRHAFHAGNFGDCVKHAVLVWLLRALQRKPASLFVLDTHAGDRPLRSRCRAGRAHRRVAERHCPTARTIRRRHWRTTWTWYARSACIPARRRSRAPCCGRTTAWRAANCIPRTSPLFVATSQAIPRSRCITATRGRHSAPCCRRSSGVAWC